MQIKDMTAEQYKVFLQNLKTLSAGIKAMLKELGFKKAGAYVHAEAGLRITLLGFGNGYRLTFLDSQRVMQIESAEDLDKARATIKAAIDAA